MKTPQDESTVEMIALPEVRRITGMGTTFIYARIAEDNFPKQRKIGKRASRWKKSEVVAWVEGQPICEPNS